MRTILPLRARWPTDWTEVFGREAPLVVEIGFGNGQYLFNLGQTRPDSNVLGIEISLPSLRRCEQKLEHSDLKNVRLAHGKANTILWTLCQVSSVNQIHINFSDPWPKVGHHQRRLINDRFLNLAATRIESGGLMSVATDHEEYAEWIGDRLIASPYFISCVDDIFLNLDEDRFQTKYELKALAQGRRCFYFKWRRNEILSKEQFAIPEEFPMPHVILTIPLTLEEIGGRFKEVTWVAGPVSVRLIDIYYGVNHNSLAIDTYINEEILDQRLLMAVTQQKDGSYKIHLHDTYFPRSTAGVHFGLAHLAQWICSQHPDSRVLRHNLHNLGKALLEWEYILADE